MGNAPSAYTERTLTRSNKDVDPEPSADTNPCASKAPASLVFEPISASDRAVRYDVRVCGRMPASPTASAFVESSTSSASRNRLLALRKRSTLWGNGAEVAACAWAMASCVASTAAFFPETIDRPKRTAYAGSMATSSKALMARAMRRKRVGFGVVSVLVSVLVAGRGMRDVRGRMRSFQRPMADTNDQQA